MKKLIILLLSLSLAAVAGCGGGSGTSGGDRPGPPPGGKRPGPPPMMDQAQRLDMIMSDLTKKLELKPEQAAKVRAIIKEGEDKKAKMEPTEKEVQSREGMEKFLDKLIAVDKETDKKLSAVLTKDQMEDYREYMDELRRKGLGKKGGGGPGGPGGPGGGRPRRGGM